MRFTPAAFGRCVVCEVSLAGWPFVERAWDVCASCSIRMNMLGPLRRWIVRRLIARPLLRGETQ